MLFVRIENYLKKFIVVLAAQRHEMFEDTIEYATVIAYEFTQYSLKHRLKELGGNGETAVT